MSLIRYVNGFRLYEKPFSTAGFTGNQFHITCYELQADLTTKVLLTEAFLGRRLKTPLLAPAAPVLPAGKGTEHHRLHPHPAQRSRWCASATVHPQTRDQRPFLDGALHKRGPAWLSPAGLKALQTAAFAWGKRNLQKQQGR